MILNKKKGGQKADVTKLFSVNINDTFSPIFVMIQLIYLKNEPQYSQSTLLIRKDHKRYA